MKKNKHINKLILALGLSVLVLGCSDDDDSNSSSAFDFGSLSTSFPEEKGLDGPVTLTIPFRNAPSSVSIDDITVDNVTATEGTEYTIDAVTQEGITITLYDDVLPIGATGETESQLETIRFTIKDGGSGNNVHTVNIVDNDPGTFAIDMVWTGAADLDLYLLHETTPGDEDFEVVGFSDPGHLMMDWTDDDGLYAVSYNYYAKNTHVGPLNFTGEFTPTSGVTAEGGLAKLIFDATYTDVNIDPSDYQIEQYFTKDGYAFEDFTDIEVPAAGSRQTGKRIVSAQGIQNMRNAIAEYQATHKK